MRISSPCLAVMLCVGCGSSGKSARSPKPQGPTIAVAAVPATALGDVHAVSYLTIAADGTLGIGRIEAGAVVDLAALPGRRIAELGLDWTLVGEPPVPATEEEIAEAGIFGQLLGDSMFEGGAFGALLGEEPGASPCGPAFHLDAAGDAATALIIPAAGASAEVVLATLERVPLPSALVARGDDGTPARPMRYVLDDTAMLGSPYTLTVAPGASDPGRVARELEHAADNGWDVLTQVRFVVEAGATAQDLLGALGGLAIVGVREVVLDTGDMCGGGGYGFDYDGLGEAYGGGFGEGGEGWGTIGTGTWGGGGDGTGGVYGGGGGGYGTSGSGTSGSGTTHASVPTTKLGSPTITGDLEAAVIRRYLKRNLAKITYCYEKELLSQPSIEGTATAAFRIGDDGVVLDVDVDGFDAVVDQCLEGVIGAIEFPKPGGNGIVEVIYPIEFKASGG